MNQAQAMKQLQRAQAEMARVQEELKSDLVTASAGGGAVKVSVTGDLTVTDVVIDPRAVDPEDVAMLQDLVVAAVNEAMRQAQELSNAKMQRVMGGMGLPGGLGF
ncbi:MAG TPA: YbaB/EbfC family nucleoid-associated protein [Coriobacteriia bacterium]|jgi:DNA-binding YbaB/EbfC family protein